MDTVYKIRGDARLLDLTRTKRKDGPTPDRLQLTLKETGESCVILSTHGADMNRSAEALLSAFMSAFGGTGATKAEIRAVSSMAPATFHRALNELVRAGLLHNTGTDHRPFYRLAGDA